MRDEIIKGYVVKYTDDKGKLRKRRITKRQVAFVEGLMQGKSPYRSALNAGYTKNSAQEVRKEIMAGKAVNALMDSISLKVEKLGLTEDFIAKKLWQWFNSKKKIFNKKGEVIGEVENEDIQIKAYDRWKERREKQDKINLPVRKITYEEFIRGGKEKGEEKEDLSANP
jgi:phage terminase small subunit